jgi:hypothetical protein
LKTRGYYQGSNVSYNLKKLVEMGYMHHQRCEIDRRSVRVRLTEKGPRGARHGGGAFRAPCRGSGTQGVLEADGMDRVNHSLKRVERFWSDQIRYIY